MKKKSRAKLKPIQKKTAHKKEAPKKKAFESTIPAPAAPEIVPAIPDVPTVAAPVPIESSSPQGDVDGTDAHQANGLIPPPHAAGPEN